MTKRRQIVLALGAGALASPLDLFAQMGGRVWRVGFMAQIARPDPLDGHFFGALPKGLRNLGYVEGKDLAIAWRFADSKIEQLPALAAELVKLNPDVIVTAGTLSAQAMRKATTTIPVVFGNVSDPVAAGLVTSLARPGGNMTGLASLAVDISAKLMETLIAAVPKISRLAVLMNPKQGSHVAAKKSLQAAADKLGVKIQFVEAGVPQDIEPAFRTMAREGAQALLVLLEGLFLQQRRQIVDLAAAYRLPAASTDNEFARAGGLLSYGANQIDMFLRVAVFVDKILKGAKPSDLPVEQPTTFEFLVNGKTAKALAVAIPQTVLFRADRVIE